MRVQAEEMIRSIKENRIKHRRKLAVLTALAVLTGGNVFWDLREIGTAMTDEALCGTETHTHSDDCFDENGELICVLDEHVHSAMCFSDETADTEMQEIWEMSLPAVTNLSRAEQAALIAESQIGVKESEHNFILGENGERRGYTRYGAWYGNPYGDWNTMFTYFCMYYAGVTAEEMPYGGNASAWQVHLTESGLLHPPETVPERGTVILLDSDQDGTADRTGIVTEAEEMLTVIEGDADNQVAARQYALDDDSVRGYVLLPEPETPAEAQEMVFNAESPEGVAVYAAAEAGAFPDDTMMTVADISRSEALQTAMDALETEEDALDVVAVDISFRDTDGAELEPAEGRSVRVQISLPDELKLSGGEYSLLHVSDDGEVQEIADAEVTAEGAEFFAESFSLYVLTANAGYNPNSGQVQYAITDYPMQNGSNGNNSQDNPLVIGLNELLEVSYDGAYKNSGRFTVFYNGEHDSKIIDRTTEHSWDYNDTNNHIRAQFKAENTGTCCIGFLKNGDYSIENTDGLLWVKVVNNAVFQMRNGNRTLIDDSRIVYAESNGSFIISLNGYNSGSIAPKEGEGTENSYALSEYLYRAQPAYSQSNTFVEFYCLKDGDTSIEINGETIRVVIGDVAYMKMKDGRRLLLDDALDELNGNTAKDIYAYEGEVLNFSVDGFRFHKITIDQQSEAGVLSKPNDASLGYLYENDNTVVPITCEKEGTGRVIVGDTTVTIHVRHPLYVKTNIMDRDIDRVNEWLKDTYAPKESGYIKNQFAVNSFDGQNHPQGRLFPYYLHVGDEFEIYSNTSNFVNNNPNFTVEYLAFYFEQSGTWGEGSWYDRYTLISANASPVLQEITPTETGTNIIAKRFRATDVGYARITLKDGNNEVRTMYVQVLPDDNRLLDHADIEIADGGKYTITKIVRNSDGSLTKTITVYKAYVSGVNSSTLYKNADETCQFYETNEQGELVQLDGVTGYREDQYHVDPHINPGEPQYEFTSKYNMKYENGVLTYYDWSNTKYYANEVDHVVFDVKIALEPSKETVYTKNPDSAAWSEGVTTNITATPENTKHLDSVKFNMDHQDVLDAFNKCPNHTGLDFTIMAHSALVELNLNKKLTGGTIQENQFEFEVLQQEVRPVRTWLDGYNYNKSDYDSLSNDGLQFKGAYRVFFGQNPTQWGSGVDSEAIMEELHANPAFSNLTDAEAVFNVAANDSHVNQKAVLDIIKRHLTQTDYTETETQYQMNNDGFYLMLFESSPIQVVRNNAEGTVTFDSLHFEKCGTYEYVIRERSGNADNILYDNTIIDFKIRVDYDADNQLVADIISDVSVYEFVNHTTFRLPDTGGCGTLPYLLGGTAMMAAACLLLYKKRREGS